MKNKKKLKIIIVLLIILVSILIIAFNNRESVLVFSSDYQDIDEININKSKNLKEIMNQIKKNENNLDLVAYLGDYQNWPLGSGLSINGINEIKDITYDMFGKVDTMFISGNHDYIDFDDNPNSFTSSGLYEYHNYSLYLINYNDYFEPTTLGNTLINDLEKVNTRKPLIILSHMPLHHSVRGDNWYSFYMFELINDYALDNDVIYLFGHNHSLGYDNDIGGSVVYKAVGDSIKIKYSEDLVANKKLNFTYMNAGYIGYYNDDTTGLDFTYDSNYSTEETISVFKISSNKIKIKRYSKEGIYKEYEIKLKK